MNRWMTNRVTVGFLSLCVLTVLGSHAGADEDKATEILVHYCFDCHGDGSDKGGLDLSGMLVKAG